LHCNNYLKSVVKILPHQKQWIIKKNLEKNRKEKEESLKYLQVIASYPIQVQAYYF
jgi:hypothetical protein